MAGCVIAMVAFHCLGDMITLYIKEQLSNQTPEDFSSKRTLESLLAASLSSRSTDMEPNGGGAFADFLDSTFVTTPYEKF